MPIRRSKRAGATWCRCCSHGERGTVPLPARPARCAISRDVALNRVTAKSAKIHGLSRNRAGIAEGHFAVPLSLRSRCSTSATSPSSRTSTTASRRLPTASSSSAAACPTARWRRRCSIRWTSSASAASPSRRRPRRCSYKARDGQTYQLNLIDTPGHVDFSYEVSRSLAACEGALLVVDASQGVEAQTVANCYTAIEQGVEVVPVLNKIDLPSAEPERVIAGDRGHHRHPGARTRCAPAPRPARACDDILEAVIARIPPPQGRSRRRRSRR